MSKRTKKATKKIERLRNRLIHIDSVPDMKVGYIFVVDNFDIGDTKRANENRWLYTIGPHRRTRYPFETLAIPGTQYTLHWFTQCRITDETQEPEFRYVSIPKDSVTLPPDSAPYVPTVQISQTKGNWTTVEQGPYFADANFLIPILSKNLNKHNFTIFDARKIARDLTKLSLPLITEEETAAEMAFLEILSRMPEKVQVPSSDHKRKAFEFEEEEVRASKKVKVEVDTAGITHRFLELLHSRHIVHVHEVSSLMKVKETKIQQIADVLSVVGSVFVSPDGFVTLRKAVPHDTFSMFGFPSCTPAYSDSLEMAEADFDTTTVVLPFSRPSSLLNTLRSPTNSQATTISSSSSSDSEPRSPSVSTTNSNDNINPLNYMISFPTDLGDREDCGWEDMIWTH